MATPFDFSSISGLNSFWDGTKSLSGGTSKPGGATFNKYATGSTANINSNLDALYQNLIGRNADPAGKEYWAKAIASGATDYKGVADAIKASTESKDQIAYLANNPNATASDLKGLGSAYVSPFNPYSGSAVAGWKPGDPLTSAVASSVTTDPNVSTSNYGDHANKNVTDAVTSFLSGGVGGGSSMQPYDDSGLLSEIASLKDAFNTYKTDMQNMWNNANWGVNQQQSTVQGVKTQNELPGWTPKKGGSSGFFGRGNRFGLTTSSLNI